ncbi:MAG: SGNH/GDSL hydrolase family protein [Hyphomicrobiales bacterium]
MLNRSTTRRAVLGGAIATTAAAMTLSARAATTSSPQHVVLLGDSIFDNGAYVGSGPDVVAQLRKRLPQGARATLTAIDGSITEGVKVQLQLVPDDATHLVVSAGGNDALHYSTVMEEKARSVNEALDKLAGVRERFQADYGAMLDAVIARGLPAACCTIYDARFPDKAKRRLASAGLTIFNECITREASARGIALIDLRLICNKAEDLANPIEPSVIGGAKIAHAIADFAAEYDSTRGRSEVFAQADGAI